MPTVPMFIQHAQPTDASHGVFAPGGYEWWHFDAEDERRSTLVTVDYYRGCPFHPRYAAKFRRYRRWPTRFRPPVPAEYPCVSVSVYRDRRRATAWHAWPRPNEMVASTDTLDITVGTNGARRRSGGGITVLAADARSGRKVDLTFHPVWHTSPWDVELFAECEVQERRLVRDAHTIGTHHWVLRNALCRVEGEVLAGLEHGALRIEGLGFHDYSYGSGPIGLDVRGRVLDEDRFVAFRRRKGIVEGTCDGVILHRDIEWPGTLGIGPVEVGGVLRTTAPEMLATSHHGTHEAYEAEYAGKRVIGFGETFGGSFGKVTAR